jgi:hypothetical protein
MIGILAGSAISLGATFWVLRPVFAHAAGVRPRALPRACPACGEPPAELDAVYCSNCGAALPR